MPRKKVIRKLASLDFETDPFLFGRVPRPFCAGLYTADKYYEFWGDDCIKQLIDFLSDCPDKYLIYAHNGGKFDYFFLLEWLQNPLTIINGRIAKCYLNGHELRDSYSILPIPLAAYIKDEIDYKLFERDKRDKNKAKILRYLRSDCEYLFNLVSRFIERFDKKLTIGSAAIAELKKYHPFDHSGESHDSVFRPYYFGGRVDCFETGVIRGDFKVYDVNSMYPYVMSKYQHPTGSKYVQAFNCRLTARGKVAGFEKYPVFFIDVECSNRGAFPTRVKNESLDFHVPYGLFSVTSHEFYAALELGLISDIKIKRVYAPAKTINFKDFVSVFSAEKIAAKKAGDKPAEIFAKLILNSSYGKFGSNPANYKDYVIHAPGTELDIDLDEYEIYSTHESGVNIWTRPSKVKRYFDVATAAGITGAARAELMRGIAGATRPIYCDTDSIICESLSADLHDSRLGAWKLEAQGTSIAVAGKKLYALRDGKKQVKSASKGSVLTDAQIFAIAKGAIIQWQNDAPTFSVSNGVRFVDRKIQSAETKKRSRIQSPQNVR